MQDKVIVSIIVPCYKAKEEWVKRALLSVRNQTYKSYELIVVDDGSSKEYHDILVSSVTENNEHLITIKNSGVSAARNIAVQSAKGDFICFLDVDDWLEPDFLERALLFQAKNNADFVIGGTVMCSDYIIHDFKRADIGNYECFEGEQIPGLIPHLVGTTSIISLDVPMGYIGRGPWSRLIRRSLALSINFDENLALGEDIVWNVRVLGQANRVCLVKECWYCYWWNDDSKTKSFNDKICYETESHINALVDILDLEDREVYLSLISRIYDQVNESWDRCLMVLRKTDAAQHRRMKEYIYHTGYWKLLCSSKTFKLSSLKMKIVVLLCRTRLFYFVKGIKHKIKL